mmetsp:Transcript_11294/g.42154  ORF Transcript_11294/g.42154 Transcript_11294/m.42154 type:complete len:320 (-) Transcript_11294:63-1022(-)
MRGVVVLLFLVVWPSAALRRLPRPLRLGALQRILKPQTPDGLPVAAPESSARKKIAKAVGVGAAGVLSGAATVAAATLETGAPSLGKTIINWSAAGVAGYFLFQVWRQRFMVKGTLESNEVQLAVRVDWSKDNVVSDLNKIAETADVSTDEGLASVVSEASKALLKHKQDWVLGFAGKRRFIGATTEGGGEKAFDVRLSNERKRWEASTRGRYQGKPIQKGAGDDLGLSAVGNGTTYAVVGILLLWDSRDGGLLPLPEEDEDRTNVVDQVEEALGALSVRVPEQTFALRAAEILWTPDEEEDVLPADEVAVKWSRLLAL